VSSWWIILFVNKSTLTACLRNRDHLTPIARWECALAFW
jgi:hypothetical protein